MDDRKRSLEPGWDHPPRLLTRHGLLPLHSVPGWEKQFVTDVCGIPWKRLLEAKKMRPGFKNIVDWDDSGARENFENAKARYWAELNGLHCEIPPPAQDLYLDKVDRNSEIDSKLMADMEMSPSQPQLSVTASHGWDSLFLADMVPVTVWGDVEDPVQSNWEMPVDKRIMPTGWVDEGFSAPRTGFVVSGFSALDQETNTGLNDPDKNSCHGWDQNNSSDSLNKNLLEAGQERCDGRNNSWVSSENKINHYGSRNFNVRRRDGCQYGNKWTRLWNGSRNFRWSRLRSELYV